MNYRFKNMAGQKWGRLTCLEHVGSNARRAALWRCKCECGAVVTVAGTSLRSGNTRSCGCLAKEVDRSAPLSHGLTVGKARPRLYGVWSSMKDRCQNPNNRAFHRYGGRGITVCEAWQQFVPFNEWAKAAGYRPGLTLDRIDNDGHYEPSNCRWVTAKQQARNTSRNRNLTYRGRTQTLGEWAEELDMPPGTLVMRLRLGWSTEKALSTPVLGLFGNPKNLQEERS